MSKKLWSGRFSEATDKIVDEFNASIGFDQRLALYDIKGSLAHVKMLAKQGIITREEASSIEDGLCTIREEIVKGSFVFDVADEDVHMAVEKRLTELVGVVGGKLHTARSRNDQVALDFRLYMRDAVKEVNEGLKNLMGTIFDKASAGIDVIMPGHTHLQSAQPVLFAHWLMAYFQMFRRDYERFSQTERRLNFSPLGAGALAGTPYDIDRHFTAKELGFTAPTANSIDSVSDRDFAIEFLSAASICMMHLSRLAEELIIFSSSEFSFIMLSDSFCTGSSIMPQKKNPDVPELIRGKTGRVYGELMRLLTVMKGLPLAYNKDMQEDKEGVFDAFDTLESCLAVTAPMLEKMEINRENMLAAASKGYSTATDLADYLVRKGLTFRQAHNIVGRAVAYAVEKGIRLDELSEGEFKTFSPLIEADVYDYITVEASVASRRSYGGTSRESVEIQMSEAKKYMQDI
jgi:argininosuccinate lyase